MISAATSISTGYRPGSARQRLVASLASGALVLIVLLLAIYQTGIVSRQQKPVGLTSFDVAGDKDKQSQEAEATARQQKEEEKTQTVRPVEQAPQHPVEPAVAEKPAFTFLRMSSQDMAMADIGKMSKGAAVDGGASAAGSGANYGPGEGPGGVVLYNADWFREPTDAQLGGYLPASRPDNGWGMIACQTLEHYRVDNCQIMAEYPRGSGFGRAALNAAWQFQVVPPRINGKPQIGAWVRIRIEYGTRRDG